MKKVVSLLMSVVMLLSVTMGMNLSVFAESSRKSIKSATLTPIKPYTVYEGKYAGWSEGTDNKGNPYKKYFYLAPDFNAGDVVNITFSDGTTDKYMYYCGATKNYDWVEGWFNSDDERIYVYPHEFTIDTADGLGKTYASYGIMDGDYNDYDYDIKNVPVEVIENPVKSFSFVPVKQYEVVKDTNGEYYDSENKTDWHYYGPDFNIGDKITVYYTKGTSEEYTYREYDDEDSCNLGFINAEKKALNVESCSFAFDGIGKTTFNVELTDYGRTTDVPVIIKENIVSSFSFIPIKPYEVNEGDYSGSSVDFDSEGNPIHHNYYLVDFNEGDKIIVNYTNGSSGEFVYKKGDLWDFVNVKNNSEVLNVGRKYFIFEGCGETTFEVKLTDYEKTQRVPVKVVKSSTDSTPTPGGGSTGGSTGGGTVPAPAPSTPENTNKKLETKPSETTPAPSISKKPATVTVSKPQPKTKSFVVHWKVLGEVYGYQIQVATNKKFKKNKKTITVKKPNASKKTVKNLKKNKKYFVRVRAFKVVDGERVYGKWSKIKSVKTK